MQERGKVLARFPSVRVVCKCCRRVDQAVARAFGSVNWLRQMPADQQEAFYRKAHLLGPKQIGSLCNATIAIQDYNHLHFLIVLKIMYTILSGLTGARVRE